MYKMAFLVWKYYWHRQLISDNTATTANNSNNNNEHILKKLFSTDKLPMKIAESMSKYIYNKMGWKPFSSQTDS